MTENTTSTAEELLSRLCDPKEECIIFKNSEFSELLAEAKAAAVARNDEPEALQFWCAETIYSIQKGYIAAFNELKAGQYYDAWCQFERCVVAIDNLNRHFISTSQDIHRIRYIELMVQRWQRLYPYKVFFSPEILKKRIECSICGARVSPRTSCGHEKSKIYSGKMCHHIIVEAEIVGISIVDKPVQLYSVAFLSKNDASVDHYNYDNLKFVIDRLESAFHSWDHYETTRIIAASEVQHLDYAHPCPCLSGKKFGECCVGKDEITVPHLQINLSVPPKTHLPENELLL